jgi:vitamin B12 transporter
MTILTSCPPLQSLPNKYLNLRADYTYTVAKDDITDQQLLRRPKNKASLTANWLATDRLLITSTLLYVGSWWDFARQAEPPDGISPLVKAPGFTTVNLAANYALRDDVTLFARIDNLFNKQYEDPAGFLRPGFGIFGGVRLTAGGISSSGLPNTIPAANTTPVAPTHRHAARGQCDG